MQEALSIISSYLGKCESCPNNGDGKCGFVEICEDYETDFSLSPEDEKSMPPEEIDLYNTRRTGQPCKLQYSYNQLMSKVERALENDSTNPSLKEINRIVSLCHKFAEEAKRIDGSADTLLNSSVESAVNIVLSYLDLRCLENGKNVYGILQSYGCQYTRERGLFRYCPEEMAKSYLENSKPYDFKGEIPVREKMVYDWRLKDMVIDQSEACPEIPFSTIKRERIPVDEWENNGIKVYGKVPENLKKKNHQSESQITETNSALALFKKTFLGHEAEDFVYALLSSADFSFAIPYWEEPGEVQLFIFEAFAKWASFEYDNWGELRREITTTIKGLKSSEEKIDKYVTSLLLGADKMLSVLYPSGKGIEYQEARLFLEKFSNTCVTSVDDYCIMWKESKAEAKRFIKNFYGDDNVYLKQVSDLMHQKAHPYIPYQGCQESWALFNIGSAITKFISIIEGCLLENVIDKSVSDFQKGHQFAWISNIDDFDICVAMGWPKYAVTHYLSITGHDIKELSAEEIANKMEWGETYAQINYQDSRIDANMLDDDNDDSACEKCEEGDISNQESDNNCDEETNNELVVSRQPVTKVIVADLKKYLEALVAGGFLERNYKWITKGHTNYHAGWAAKIMIANVEGITYEKITDIIGVKGLADSASKCQNQGKTSKIEEIETCFKNAGLSTTH